MTTPRKAHWEQIYTDKSPAAVSWYQAEPTRSLQMIRSTGLPHDAALIDIGGGASLLVDQLCAEDYQNIAVLDISGKALAHAKNRLGEKAHDITWIEADITTFVPPYPFDLWHDRAVFHFLTEPSDRSNYVAALKQSLRPGGHLILAAFALGGPTRCSGLDIVQYNAGRLQAQLGAAFELVAESTETHLTPSSNEQLFAYFHFMRIG